MEKAAIQRRRDGCRHKQDLSEAIHAMIHL